MPGRKYPLVTQVNTPTGEFPITSFVTQDTFDSVLAYKPDPDDLFVCTFPKNGTTWTLYILHMLRGGCLDFPEGDNLSKHYACIDFIGGEATKERHASPRLIQTHLRFGDVPFSDSNKYVFVARNPKDTVVSFFYHTLGFEDIYDYADGKFDDFFDHFVAGEHDFGDYFRMVPLWWEESKKRHNVHFVLYEDLKSDFESELTRMARFLGDDCYQNLIKNDKELLKAICQKAHISNMKKSVKTFMPRKRPDHLPFTRKGVIGDWKNLLSEQQSRILDDKMQLAGKLHPGFDLLWGKYLD